ncbi:branched-chain amino acid aminotransferase [Psychrobacillus sp. NEAU-3TGS]|uniref:branched-chain amino acid aminotransferase n=1 Tax=Psychrobacillus sp. NEAU-3TGS TaxID=2995412 RepID=UPI0024998DC5|nr:branched-chain amino acid aminotransferase [Psychrobacillus sp. NEAU-3TGS]MDI2589065.1 branched-chain amino acid aminotransferase [Psychrobacillus sp. NEAU-3TGS]
MSKPNVICERYDKETEELVSKDSMEFLSTPLSHFKEKKNEYAYLQSENLNALKVDGLVLEYDEVFEVYTAMFGLAVQKKLASKIGTYLDEHYNKEKMNYSMMFSGDEGLWEINLPLNYIDQFSENFTIEEAYQFLQSFISSLVEALEL